MNFFTFICPLVFRLKYFPGRSSGSMGCGVVDSLTLSARDEGVPGQDVSEKASSVGPYARWSPSSSEVSEVSTAVPYARFSPSSLELSSHWREFHFLSASVAYECGMFCQSLQA